MVEDSAWNCDSVRKARLSSDDRRLPRGRLKRNGRNLEARGGYNCYNTPSDGRMDGERVNSRGSLRSIFPFQAQSPSSETPFGSNLRCAAMTAAYVSAMIGMRNGAGVAAHPKAIRRNVRKATADFPRPAKTPRKYGRRNIGETSAAIGMSGEWSMLWLRKVRHVFPRAAEVT